MRARSTLIFCLTAITAVVALSGCETLGYYTQAASGQFYILTHRQPVDALLQDSNIDVALKAKLAVVDDIRQFAREQLRLPVGKDYSTYADLKRPYVVWNVFAAPEFSMQPQSWCYPVAGCVSYRGYFSENAANEFARKTADAGYDVYVGGVAAYSTLGWFSDSVLNTVINREPHQLAALIFHELAHQVVYIPGDTVFNESFAGTVERVGMQRWLENAVTDEAQRSRVMEQAAVDIRRQEDFVALVSAAVADLQVIYDRDISEADKREAKVQRLQMLRDGYESLKQNWGGYGGYDNWFSRDLNNAQLSTVATYNNLVPQLMEMFEAANGNFEAFYAAAAEFGKQRSAMRND